MGVGVCLVCNRPCNLFAACLSAVMPLCRLSLHTLQRWFLVAHRFMHIVPCMYNTTAPVSCGIPMSRRHMHVVQHSLAGHRSRTCKCAKAPVQQLANHAVQKVFTPASAVDVWLPCMMCILCHHDGRHCQTFLPRHMSGIGLGCKSWSVG